jgi:hypothetical protein
MLTQDILLDLFVVLGPGCNSGLLWHVPHRLAAHPVKAKASPDPLAASVALGRLRAVASKGEV